MPRGYNRAVAEPEVPSITEFEKKCIELNLAPDMFLGSGELRAWAGAHKNTRYVPESLLKAWRIVTEVSF
jgi:hypothetical protein